jgi:hypothetical protein
LTALRLFQDSVSGILGHSRLHYCTADGHPMILAGVISETTVKFARIDVSVASVFERLMHHLEKLGTKLISGWHRVSLPSGIGNVHDRMPGVKR